MPFFLDLYKQPAIQESTVDEYVLHYKGIVLSGRTRAKALMISPTTILFHGSELENTKRICNDFKQLF